ncbi:MAG TPA: excinuclease ABC subunit UvrC [Methanothermobacter sp.]|nr:excinuclease ABC subunit UvrC [Methanothermobacter sp.]
MSTTITNPDDLPEKPGVYLLKDVHDNILYVGKAKSLKKRVKSYFKVELDDPKTRILMRHFHHLEYLVTDTEKEALILESNLIKKNLPRYNIRLKDDKRFPYVQITSEEYPKLLITRNLQNEGSSYYGPFTDVTSVRNILKLLKPVFRLRDCKRMDGPCLNYQIDLCPAPCSGNITKEDYLKNVEKAKLFLEGRHEEVLELLRTEMQQAAQNHDYEKAAVIRDQLFSLDEVMEKQKMEFNRNLDQDVISYALNDDVVVVVVFRVRSGKIMGKEDFLVEGAQDNYPQEILGAFIKQYYSGPRSVPAEILLPIMIPDEKLITKWLSEKMNDENPDKHPKKYLISLKVPEEGLEHRLVQMVTKNAKIITNHYKQARVALLDLKKYLKIPRIPRRIEAFDVSNLGGKMAVASMVVFEDGKPKKSHYRKFKLKTPGPDDYAMMREVLTRRYKKLAISGGKTPDLIMVDGGRGQLNVAKEVLNSLDIKTGVIGLAEEFEQIFIPEVSIPLILPKDSTALHLLQSVRDEAHRFAVTYHRKLRQKDAERSLLDEIPGVGPKRKMNLLRHFGDLTTIKTASLEQIEDVKGINKNLALKIHDFFHQGDE